MSRIDEIQARCDKATTGPWFAVESDDGHEIRMGDYLASYNELRRGGLLAHHIIEYNHNCEYDDEIEDDHPANQQAEEANANAEFIAHAREDIPWLLSELARKDEEIERLTAQLEQYRQAEDDGKLVRMPCWPGDTVYVIDKWSDEPYVFKTRIEKMEFISSEVRMMCIEDIDVRFTKYLSDFGKTVFLTEQSARAAMDAVEHDTVVTECPIRGHSPLCTKSECHKEVSMVTNHAGNLWKRRGSM